MRILFLTQVLPYPLDAGPKVRAYYVLRYLAQFHEITLVSFIRKTDTPETIAHLETICANVFTQFMPRSKWLDGLHFLRSLVTNRPFLIERDWVPAMDALITEVVRKVGPFDAVHADQLWMAPYALKAKTRSAQGHAPTTVLDQHNAVYLIPQRMAEDSSNPVTRALLRLESQKLARFEVNICRQFDQVVWVTQEDYAAVQRQASDLKMPDFRLGAIPICVDTEAVPFVRRKRNARRITFLGGLHYPPNAEGVCWFAEKVFPLVLDKVPDAVLTVIGKQPPPKLEKLGIPSANLDVAGYVADPMPYLEETVVFIVPLHSGGGMRVKILDAWAWGMPIVSTTVGAEGIHCLPSEHLLIADTAEDFAQSVLHLYANPQRGEYMAKAGRRWVEQNYTWQSTYRLWEQVYTLPQSERAGTIK